MEAASRSLDMVLDKRLCSDTETGLFQHNMSLKWVDSL
jgi:hypothetical protein